MLLSISLLTPLIGFFILLFKFKSKKLMFYIALLTSLVSFIASLLTLLEFQISPHYQLHTTWFHFNNQGFNWDFALDGISLSLYLLTTSLFLLGIIYSYSSFQHNPDTKRVKFYWLNLLFLEFVVLGVFTSTNLITFYLFWELSLIPMVFLITIWGGQNKKYAGIKFFLYTFSGSVFLLVAIIATAVFNTFPNQEITFSMLNLAHLTTSYEIKKYIFWGFIISFLIKLPAFPVHTWLPHAHTEAPTFGSIILAGVLLKMGVYGILRFILPLFPTVSIQYASFFMWLGVIGIIYGAWLAWSQNDIKKMIAYSSVSHMGYILMGLFTGNSYGLSGAYLQMINHGISTGLLFLLIGILYDRTHTRKIDDYSGLAQKNPLFAIFFFIATLSSIGLPLTNGFVGEFLILLGAFSANKTIGGIAVLGVILGAVYMLHLYKKIFFGQASSLVEKLHFQLNYKEIFIIIPFIIFIFWLGVKPDLVLKSYKKSMNQYHVTKSKR